MADDSDPPRVFYQLKPREFERVNAPVNSTPTDPSPTPGTTANAEGRIDVQELYRKANFPGPVLTPNKAGEKNEVHAILQGNLDHANAAGLNEIAPKPKRRSRRTRDYFIVLIALDLFFGAAAFGPYSNVGTMAYGVAGIIISTVGLTWIMFFVMDDY
jgi:hypothetical protein